MNDRFEFLQRLRIAEHMRRQFLPVDLAERVCGHDDHATVHLQDRARHIELMFEHCRSITGDVRIVDRDRGRRDHEAETAYEDHPSHHRKIRVRANRHGMGDAKGMGHV